LPGFYVVLVVFVVVLVVFLVCIEEIIFVVIEIIGLVVDIAANRLRRHRMSHDAASAGFGASAGFALGGG